MRFTWLALVSACLGCAEPSVVVARGSLIVDWQSARSTDPTTTHELSAGALDALVATHVEAIRSRRSAEHAVMRLGLQYDPTFLRVPPASRDAFSGVPLEQAARELQRALSAERVEDALVISVSFTHSDRQLATRVCDAVLQTAVESDVEARMTPIVLQIDRLSAEQEELERERVEARRELDDAGGAERATLEERLAALDGRWSRIDAELLELDRARRRVTSAVRIGDPCAIGQP